MRKRPTARSPNKAWARGQRDPGQRSLRAHPERVKLITHPSRKPNHSRKLTELNARLPNPMQICSGPTGSGPAVSPGTPGASQVDNPPKPETKPQSQAYRAQRSAPKPDADPGQPDFVPGQLIVQFKRNATAQQVEEVQKMVGAVLKEKLSSKGFSASGVSGHEEAGGLQLLVLPAQGSAARSPRFSASSAPKSASTETSNVVARVRSAVKLIANHPAVQFAEPNYLFHATETKTSKIGRASCRERV